MGDELLVSCNSQEEWDDYLNKNRLVVVCFITSNSPSRELIRHMKALARRYAVGRPKDAAGSSNEAARGSTAKTPEATVKFLQVDVNNFKPKPKPEDKDFRVTEVPSVMFVNNKRREFTDYKDLDPQKLEAQIAKLSEN